MMCARSRITARRNLMIWNAAIYCTRVERDLLTVALRCTLVYLFGSWNTLVQAATPQCWMGDASEVRPPTADRANAAISKVGRISLNKSPLSDQVKNPTAQAAWLAICRFAGCAS